MEKCEICGKEVALTVDCVNCGKSVCKKCHEVEGGFAMNPGVVLCKTCIEDLIECEGCGLHYKVDELDSCEACDDFYCKECMPSHKESCSE